jgi:hypothetical protein
MEPITLALTLAQFAPSLIKFFTGSDKAADVAGKVIDIAKTVTGAPSGDAALEVLKADPNKVLEFRQAAIAQDADLTRAFLADVQSARARDVELAKAGMHNYRANVLAGAALLLVMLCLAIVIWMSNADDFAKATISLILGRALGWVEQLFSFEFGTTRANKTKDDTINKLSGA